MTAPEFEVTGFDHPVAYATVGDGLRMAYVTAGPPDGRPVVLLHGEPTWSYLWREVIPVLAGEGHRVIAPDLVGFGRSDRPADVADHSYAAHVEWVRALLFDALDLNGVTVVGHDWGGLIGLRLATEHTGRFAAFVATNTGLPTGDQPMPEAWLRFRDTVRNAAVLDIARLVRAGCRTTLPAEVLAAYAAPFPDASYGAAPRAMPGLVPTTPDDPATGANRLAWQRLGAWDRPFLVAFSDGDQITSAMGPVLARVVPGATHVTIPGGGHFLQEDTPGPL
ncbi:MAG TPA: haloalkane dehalogenase, partial [Micromonosporaceae bacterium]|nr:haloalkane dehalogenase [Micromonosporaceae bacterium]